MILYKIGFYDLPAGEKPAIWNPKFREMTDEQIVKSIDYHNTWKTQGYNKVVYCKNTATCYFFKVEENQTVTSALKVANLEAAENRSNDNVAKKLEQYKKELATGKKMNGRPFAPMYMDWLRNYIPKLEKRLL